MWKHALQLPLMNQTNQEVTTYRCMNEACFNATFEEFIKNETVLYVLSKEQEGEVDTMRDEFMECVQRGGPLEARTYK